MHSMENHLLNILILLLLTTYAPHANCSIEVTDEVKTAIENGLALGSALAEVLKEGNFVDSLVKLGTNIGPFLGVLGPLAGLILAFIPTGDSEELIFMRKQFGLINGKLDFITAQFTEIKLAIDWSTVTTSYGVYERKIRAAEENINRVYQVEGQTRENEKENFIIQYESDFDNSVQKLYDVMMFNEHVISDNILEAVVKKTKNHKRKTEQFFLGLVQLLLQGIKVKISYYGMKEWASDHVVTEWETKMSNLRDKLQTVSADVKSNWLPQMKLDSKELLLEYHGLGNQGLMDKLYDFLTEKYDWQLWFVAVYDDMSGFDSHNMWQNGGIYFLHQHDKNTIIASQNKMYSSRFNKNRANTLLQIIQLRSTSAYCRKSFDRAHSMVTDMEIPARVGDTYIPYALRLALLGDNNLVYRCLESHISVHQIKENINCCRSTGYCNVRWNYIMIVFG